MSPAAVRSLRRVRALLGVAATIALLAPVGARAEESAPPFIVRDTRTAAVALENAARDLAGSEPRLGVLGIQKVLDTVADDLVVDLVTPLQTRWIPAPEAARRLLAKQPPAVLADFDTLASPTARALLERAIADRDERRLAEIAARFLPSSTAVEASRLLAETTFERGAPRDAAVALRRALRFAPSDAWLWRRLVDALDASDDALGLAALSIPQAALDADVATGAAPSLAARLDAAKLRTAPLAEEALARARASARADVSSYDHRLARRNWTAGSTFPSRTNDQELGYSPYESDGGATMRFSERLRRLVPLFPAVSGRFVVLSDGFTVAAHDLLSGRRAWSFPDEEHPVPGLPVSSLGRGAPRGRTALELRHAPFVADGRVFAVVETTAPYVMRELSGVEITTYRPRRVLVALDAETGDLAWHMGASPADEAALAGLSVASDPVVADGVATVVLSTWEKRWRVFLAAFDARTGALRWKREVVGGQQELNLFGEVIHELVAGTPAVADGVVYATTGLGVLAAADLRTGELRWLTSYPTTELRLVEVWFTTPMRFPTWGPSPIVAYGDALLAAPGEGPNLLCFDRADGTLRWTRPSEAKRESEFVDQFLGVTNDGKRDVAVVTGSSVRGLDLKTGKPVWREMLPEGTFARGRGALSRTAVYVPTTRGLSRYSIPAEGRFLGDEPWPRGSGPGNVCLFPEVLVVAGRRDESELFGPADDGATGGPVQAFYDWEEIEAKLAVRRTESPNDPAVVLDAADLWRVVGKDARAEPLYAEGRRLAEATGSPALVERARRGVYLMHLDRGDAWAAERRVPDARTAYERALALASGAAERIEVRVRLDRLFDEAKLEGARVRNLEALATEAGEAAGVLDPGEGEVPIRVAARLRLATLARAAGRASDAVDALQAILAEDGTVAYGGEPARTRATREIASIVRETGPDAYAKHEREAKRRLEAALLSTDAAPLERLLVEYPNASVVPGALLGLADRLEVAGSHADAAGVYRRFLAAYPERADAPSALARLARALVGARSVAPARAALAALERRHPDATVTVAGASYPTAEFVRREREHLGPPPAPAPEARLSPPLSLKLEEAVETDNAGARVLPTVRAADATGAPPVLVDVGSDVVAIDGATAAVRFRKPWGRSAAFSLVIGDVLVVTRPGELVGLDPKSGQELWRHPVNGIPTALDGGLGQVLVAVKRPGERARWTILALDPVSSDELWSREVRDEPVEGLAVGEEAFVLVRRRSIPNAAGGTRTVLVLAIHSLLSGEPTKEVLLSPEGWTDAGWRLADPRTIVTTSTEGRTVRLDAVDLATGRPRWSKLLDGTARVRYLLPRGDALTVIGFEGRVRVLAIATGEVRRDTAIVGGVDALFGTEPLVEGERMYALLRTGGSTVLAAFDLATGRATWTTPTSVPVQEGWFRKNGDVLVTIQAPMRRRRDASPMQLIAVVDARTGDVIHRIEGAGLSGWRPSASISDGSLVIAGEHAFAVYR